MGSNAECVVKLKFIQSLSLKVGPNCEAGNIFEYLSSRTEFSIHELCLTRPSWADLFLVLSTTLNWSLTQSFTEMSPFALLARKQIYKHNGADVVTTVSNGQLSDDKQCLTSSETTRQ
ncbi:hypothetical protein AAG570_011813 [Ranatra chinensis]|uniref:Uncharacterized protein n=1 Tax=Ranatra chinensis TaxID=642074 RepID=A0ABD0YVF6_9HEMI